MAPCSLKLYTSAQCPFARRAMIAMKEKQLPCEYITIPLGGQLKKMEEETMAPDDSGRKMLARIMEREWPGKTVAQIREIKEDYKKSVNPSGEVPSLVMGRDTISEADVVAEFLDDAFPASGCSLMPRDAVARSKIRHAHKMLSGGNGVTAMYSLLMNQDPSKDHEKREKLYKGLADFARLASEDGPYFLGQTFSFIDIMLMPMFDQFRFVLPHYRGVELIPADAPWAARMRKWASAVERRDSFTSLSQGKDAYLATYKAYTGDRGASKLGM
jgi:glutathione S-transferase